MACILLSSSAVRVHDSQAHRKVDVTRERVSRVLELREMVMPFQTGLNLVNAAVVWRVSQALNAWARLWLVRVPGLGCSLGWQRQQQH